jgi:hypothetical protein
MLLDENQLGLDSLQLPVEVRGPDRLKKTGRHLRSAPPTSVSNGTVEYLYTESVVCFKIVHNVFINTGPSFSQAASSSSLYGYTLSWISIVYNFVEATKLHLLYVTFVPRQTFYTIENSQLHLR